MGDIEEDLAKLSLEDGISTAVRDFEKIQRHSNQKWLRLQVDELSSSGQSQQKLEDLATSRGYDSWDTLKTKHELPSNAADIDAIRWVTRPAVSQDQHNQFLQCLQAAVNRVYDQESPQYRPVQLPKDYGILLSITDGVRDADLRNSGVCGLDGIRGSDVDRMTVDDVEKLPYGHRLWRSGWELSTGFVLGSGSPARENWLVYYYCARKEVTSRGSRTQKPDEIQDHEKKWRWRLFYKEPERFQHSFFNPMVFNGIVEWLGFYQDWLTRLTETYPEWKAKMARDVDILYPDNPEQEGELGPE